MHAQTSSNGLFSRLTLRRAPFSETVTRARELIDSPEGPHVQEVVKTLSHDPLACLTILKRANHAYYGYGGHVDGLTHAVELLGADHTARMLIRLGSTRKATAPPTMLASMAEHARQTGRIAHRIATGMWLFEEGSKAIPGTLFTLCLLHSIGRLILVSSFPNQARSLYGDADSTAMFVSRDWSMAERLQFGADAVEITEYTCRKLRLPDSAAEILRLSGRPESLPPGHPVHEPALLIRLSSRLASATGYGLHSTVSYLEILQDKFWAPYMSAGLVEYPLIDQLKTELVPSGRRTSGRAPEPERDRHSINHIAESGSSSTMAPDKSADNNL